MYGQETIERIRKIAEDICAREGCYLYDLELVGTGGHRALRVYIDKEIDGGASIADCTNVSRGFNEILDADEELIPGGEYDLEVSTPGLERVLKEPRHFAKFIGKPICVKASTSLTEFNPEVPELGLAKQVTGPLVSYDENGVRLIFELPTVVAGKPSKKAAAGDAADGSEQETGREVYVPFASISKAHSVFEFEEAPKGLKNPHKGSKGPKKKS